MLKSSLLKSFLFLATFIFCVSAKAQVVINEVMVNPQTSSTSSQFQSLKMCSQTTYGNEYIELYNPTACPVDISCYLIGFNGNFATGINGTFRFPAGSVIQPNGFLSIGGPNSGATINLVTFCSTANLSTDADRWYLPNGDGYLILWDASGVAIDAVYWTTNANEASKWGTDSDISLAPTTIAAGTTCAALTTLDGPSQIPVVSSVVSYAGQAPSIGTVIHRTNDGAATWATNGVATINACNGTCQSAGSSIVLNATVSQPTCGNSDGSISFSPSPTDTYTYVWSAPASNTSNVATLLAQGSYSITITNTAGCSIDTTITLVEDCGGCNVTATVSVVQNSACQPCDYNGPTILINEINIFPNNGDGCIFGMSPTAPGNGEWIELFNPNWCDSIDISGYILGSYNSTGSAPGGFLSTPPYRSDGMGFVLPQGTVVPPLGFVVVRGANAPAPPAGTIDVIVNNVNNNICVTGGLTNSRMWFANSGGWFAFYNAAGVPQNAIKWSSPTAGDLNQSPCIPSNNFLPVGTTTLPTFNQIQTLGLTATLGNTSQGFTYRRMPDGGAWSATTASETSSYGTCNDPANCAVVSAIANCNGTATVNVTTGTAPFTYQWNDPLNQTTQTATNLCDGTYQVIVTDADLCTQTYSANVTTNPFSLTSAVQQPACQQNNGSISLNPFSATYTYSWSPNVSTTNTASNLAQGSYTITITEGSCSFDTTIVLQNPVPFTATLTSTNTTCGNDNGSVSIATTPAGNYTYTWTPNVSTSNSASQLPAGNYSIAITDNVCGITLQATILPSQALSSSATVTQTSCNQSNGYINLDVSPTATYTYIWNPSISTADTAINLASGTYTINYTDGTCSDDTTITIAPSVAPIDIIANITATNCGTNNGALSVNQINGGIAPYLYSFGGQPYVSTMNYPNLDNADYVLSVQDANGCLYQETFSVPEIPGPSQLFTTTQNPNCGYNNGFITIDGASGGIQPYDFTFNNQPVATLNFTDLFSGNYLVSVIDNYGCTFSQNIVLVNEAGISNVFIPNVFTPNKDVAETNEVWRVTATCVQTFECQIFNRWGDMVYEFGDINGYWDGRTLKGKEVVDGVYFYKVTLGYYDNTSDVYQGHITVIR